MSDEEKVLEGLQCMACRLDIDDDAATGYPRVCDQCAEEQS